MSRALVTIRTEDDRRRIAVWAMKVPAGTRVELKAPRRSIDQNDKMWAMLTDISRQVVWYGQKLSAEDWKDICSASLRKCRVVPGLDAGTFVPLGMRTSDMSKQEMSDLLELISAFGAEKGVTFNDERNL